ncbi:hypothetical protein B1R94_07845 [Mycolicibacterium litorale]|nr:hypothetical protein B1R94_07845 [Mycolicibacterium litorale]
MEFVLNWSAFTVPPRKSNAAPAPRKYVTINEAAEYLSVHPNSIRNWIENGKLTGTDYRALDRAARSCGVSTSTSLTKSSLQQLRGDHRPLTHGPLIFVPDAIDERNGKSLQNKRPQ